MVKLTREEVRSLGEDFIEHLKETQQHRTWAKPLLKDVYEKFRIGLPRATSYSAVLFNLSRSKPKLRVKHGYVYFKETTDWTKKDMTKYVFYPSVGAQTDKQKIFKALKNSKTRDAMLSSRFVEISCVPHDVENACGYFTCDLQKRDSFTIKVRNSSSVDIQLEKCLFLRDAPYMKLSDKYDCTSLTGGNVVKMPPGSAYEVNVTCNATNQVGSYYSDLFFNFYIVDSRETHVVMRYLRYFKSDDITEMLRPTKPYKRQRVEPEENVEIICGEKEIFTNLENELSMSRSLPKSQVEKEVSDAFDRGVFKEESDQPACIKTSRETRMLELLGSDLNFENYAMKFALLLQIEEKQAQIDILNYSLRSVEVEKRGRRFALKVPGLAERRPSVLRGDKILLRKVIIEGFYYDSVKYEGCVHQVLRDEVLLGLNNRFGYMHVNGMRFNVSFTFNPLPMKLQHRAVGSLTRMWHKNVLFPSKVRDIETVFTLKMYNRNIEKNDEQSLAVKSIVCGAARAPYIIYGPPGTGKTVTMVEAIKQVVINQQKKVLVCAPSNSACDLLVERLLEHVDKKMILRMHAMSRPWMDVPEIVKEVSNRSVRGDDYSYPSKEVLLCYNIIATTVITAGRLSSAEFPTGHFDYIFIDEAGHAVEPECMIAVDGLLSEKGRLVLAGDPKQLGPILRSYSAVEYGLDVSFLERLMENQEIYQPDDKERYNHHVITKLLRNYRSHDAILKIPNECFYENELKVCADVFVREQFCRWEHLPKKGFPIIFHGVKGEDQREGNSPSYFNPVEASVVHKYLEKILDTRQNPVEPKQIGIISPYRKQVQKLRKMLEVKKVLGKLVKIKIGSVEEFQGQERRVIIISTVRSNSQHLIEDEKYKLGFLRNPKRFNVALTRAMSLLIVIGNPEILCLDPYWNRFLLYCQENNGYTGMSFIPQSLSSTDDEIDDIAKRLESIGLNDLIKTPNEVSDLQSQVDPPWRDEI